MNGYDHEHSLGAAPAGTVGVNGFALPSGRMIVECTPIGRPDASQLVSVYEMLTTNAGYPPDIRALWDFRGFDFSPYDPAVCRKQVFSLERFPHRKGVKRGCLVDSELGYGHMRMFQELLGGFGIDDMNVIHVSYSRDELIGWLDS
ncbi:hypothetical protein [Tropicibacter oceani]|uniref:Uncharacterized protein n=1 Tax=Tropicibacter oceani TaxID=3058420 RepID=A0ABY8QMW3_9RHOB|nr:hypothetical protein [Tropicibacter oceani]WGW05947.1 hypothetical protein QF118_18920 [Tropicibacter oceani]